MYPQGTVPNDAVYQQHMLQTTSGYLDSLPAHMSLPQTAIPSSSSNPDIPVHGADTSIDNQDDDGDVGGKRRRVQRACDVSVCQTASQPFPPCPPTLIAEPSHSFTVPWRSYSYRLAARKRSVATASNLRKALVPTGTFLLVRAFCGLQPNMLTSPPLFARPHELSTVPTTDMSAHSSTPHVSVLRLEATLKPSRHAS